jgi:hypothetical protein
MACLRACITQTHKEAYAHHIQRLMVTGNFALLAGVNPHALHEWYLAVYADAYEWVELPNTIGISQFADGGLLASKPYAASGAYINRMSDYCGACAYNVKARVGPGPARSMSCIGVLLPPMRQGCAAIPAWRIWCAYGKHFHLIISRMCWRRPMLFWPGSRSSLSPRSSLPPPRMAQMRH